MYYVRLFIHAFNYFCMFYTLLLALIYLAQLIHAYFEVRKNIKRNRASDYRDYMESENLPPVSLLIPAYNERDNIVGNVTDLLNMDYPEFELIVVNDGSTDDTHACLLQAFGLEKIEYAIRVSIKTKNVRGVYYNPAYPRLLYIEKENGGKSDALNAGINASLYPLFVCLDADSRLEKDAVLKLATRFIKDAKTVVAGGLVRVANGAVIKNGIFESFRLPERAVERYQIVEYFRAFFAGRVSWSKQNALLIVSGAFGLFSKQAVIEAGGYRTGTIGEDMEIILRLHRHMRDQKKPYSIYFDENAVCWTQGPMSLRDLRSQRRRWQIGLMDSLLLHKDMLFNPRYGRLGMLGIPYGWLFELLGAPIEVLGYIIIPLSYFLNELSLFYFVLYLTVATCLGIMVSLGGLILEQTNNKGVLSSRDIRRLTAYALLENFGYRQIITLFRVEGMLRFKKSKARWGRIRRAEFNRTEESSETAENTGINGKGERA